MLKIVFKLNFFDGNTTNIVIRNIEILHIKCNIIHIII